MRNQPGRAAICALLALAVCLLLLTVLPFVAYAADEAGGHAPKGIIEASLATLIITVVVFVCALLVLWKFAWGPLLKALDERELRIRDALEAADRAREESRQIAAEHERVLADARREATSIVEEGKRDAQVVKDGIISTARSEAESLKTKTLAEIERAKTNAIYEIHDVAVGLSYRIAEKVIGKTLTKGDQDALVKETIQRYGASS